MMCSIFPDTCLPSVILWWGVCSDTLPFFCIGLLFPYCWILHVLFSAYFAHKPFIKHELYRYFSQSLACYFHSLNSIFYRADIFHFDKVQLMNSYFPWNVFVMLSLKTHCLNQGHLDFLLLFLRSFMALCFIFRSMILELIFMTGVRFTPRIIFVRGDIQLLQHRMLKWPPFIHWIALL